MGRSQWEVEQVRQVKRDSGDEEREVGGSETERISGGLGLKLPDAPSQDSPLCCW